MSAPPSGAEHNGRVPLVGVTTYYAEVAWGPWRRHGSVLQAAYFELVAVAGGRPLLLPHARTAPGGSGARETVDVLDALVLTGGGDLDPSAYSADPHPAVLAEGGVDPDRDRWELALLRAALERDLPILAICRGTQVLNVGLGGSLVQHLPDEIGDRHQRVQGIFEDIDVVTVAGTRLSSLLREKETVRCSHHQAIDRLGEGLVVSARSADPLENLVEAVELPQKRFVLGVQWHPEEAGDARLFNALVAATVGDAAATRGDGAATLDDGATLGDRSSTPDDGARR